VYALAVIQGVEAPPTKARARIDWKSSALPLFYASVIQNSYPNTERLALSASVTETYLKCHPLLRCQLLLEFGLSGLLNEAVMYCRYLSAYQALGTRKGSGGGKSSIGSGEGYNAPPLSDGRASLWHVKSVDRSDALFNQRA